METFKSINWKDFASRAAWTFLQAFIAVFLLSGESMIDLLFNGDLEALIVLLVATSVAALAAGLSALKTITIELVRMLKEDK